MGGGRERKGLTMSRVGWGSWGGGGGDDVREVGKRGERERKGRVGVGDVRARGRPVPAAASFCWFAPDTLVLGCL